MGSLQTFGGPHDVTVVHYVDSCPFLVWLSDPDDTFAAVVQATCEVLGVTDANCRVIDCASGLTLAYSHRAGGFVPLDLSSCRHLG